MPSLTFSDLATGLEKFGDRYTALDVFVHDVDGLDLLLQGQQVSGLENVTNIGPNVFSFSHDGRQYDLLVFPDHGVVRVTRNGQVRTETMAGAALGTAVGGAIGSAVSRPQDREIAALAGMALGLLIGGAIGAAVADATPARRIFALRFDADKKRWQAYDGGLVRWMKEKLAGPGLA
jgi:outer membrane lipoprotein SlyB